MNILWEENKIMPDQKNEAITTSKCKIYVFSPWAFLQTAFQAQVNKQVILQLSATAHVWLHPSMHEQYVTYRYRLSVATPRLAEKGVATR